MKKYVEIVEKNTDKVVKRLNVTQMSKQGADLVFRECSINPNTHYKRKVESETELETGTL